MIVGHRKGVYAIITAFIFVIIGIVLIMGVLFYQSFILDFENTAKDDLNIFQVAKDARDRFFYCYGATVSQDKLAEDCEMPVIKGYKVEVLEQNGCVYFEKEEMESMRYRNRVNYAVAVVQDGQTCLGKLQIFI